MVKLIIAALLFQSWIAQGQATLHCIPIEESRALHEMAGKYFMATDALFNRDARIVILENKVAEQIKDYEQRLSIAAANLTDQKAISLDFQKHSQSFSDQLKYYEKINKKQKRQNVALKIGLTVAAGFIVFQAAK